MQRRHAAPLTSIDDPRIARMVEAVQNGAPALQAAQAGGIHKATFWVWMKRGEDAARDPETGDLVDPADEPFVVFAEGVRAAETQAEELAAQLVLQAGRMDWRAAAWYLERRHPERWARRTVVRAEVAGPDGETVRVDTEATIMAFLAQREAAMADAEGIDDGPPRDVIASQVVPVALPGSQGGI